MGIVITISDAQVNIISLPGSHVIKPIYPSLGHTTDITGFIIPDVHVYSHHWKASGRDQPEGILTGSPVALK